MTENEYRELFMALRLRPGWARELLTVARTQADHLPYPLAVAAVRAQGVTLRQLADDFGVSRERARTIGLAGLRALEREVLRLPEDGHGLGAEELLDRPVDVLGLDVRPANALHRGGVATIRQLVSHSAAELLRLPYLGELSLRNIRHRLAACGLSLRRCPGDARPPE